MNDSDEGPGIAWPALDPATTNRLNFMETLPCIGRLNPYPNVSPFNYNEENTR